MGKLETDWGHDRGRHLYVISGKASRMVTERIGLERMGLDLKNLPLCTMEEAMYIEEFVPRAKEGFALSLKADKVRKNELIGMLAETTPFTIQDIWERVGMLEEENTLPEYGHFIATLAYLLRNRIVSYYLFENPGRIEGTMGQKETYWNFNTSSWEDIWTVLEKIESLTRRTLYQRTPLGEEDLFRIGHFFAAGAEVAKIFVK